MSNMIIKEADSIYYVYFDFVEEMDSDALFRGSLSDCVAYITAENNGWLK